MKIIFFTHPDFLKHQSMPRFTNMLVKGMLKRGHKVEIWKPEPVFYYFSNKNLLKKWLGYVDQYIIFPHQVKKKILQTKEPVLYVFIDQALGPWIPLTANKAHVVHCHDFLAQLSALGKIKQNRTSYTGKIYQNFIRSGYSKGKNFISVSKKTKADLHEFLITEPLISEVVYNGLNQLFIPIDKFKAREIFSNITGISFSNGFILHIGGNQWYKNRLGIIDIYNTWRGISRSKHALLLIGEKVSVELEQKIAKSLYANDIHILDNMDDESIRIAYCSASVFLFPSIAEGFGWPIAEAMASGCPVITTDAPPMTEVAGNAAFLIPVMPENDTNNTWAMQAANKLDSVLNLSAIEYELALKKGLENAKRFETEVALDAIERIYIKILKQ